MADPDWNLGKPKPTVTLAVGARGNDWSEAVEVFKVTNCESGCIIRAIRPRDHVDLLFHFRGLECSGLDDLGGQPKLSKIRGVQRRKVRVFFPPQHIAEGIKDKPLGDGACETATDWGPMRVHMSQPSRLVFSISDQSKWQPRLRLNELTDWSSLTPLLHRRAGVGPEITDQLAAAFPGLSTAELKDLTFIHAQTHIAAGLEGPAEGETAIEIPSRLILSPSKEGRWIVPEELPDVDAAPLWTARLDRGGRASVRAIWSSRLEPHVFPTDLKEPASPSGPMLSLTRRNHWEVVAQTSIYGLPGLRRLSSDSELRSVGTDLVSNASSVPRPTVVRPDTPIGYLDEIDGTSPHNYVNHDSGIALATPFDDGDLSASALGGFANLSWRGDPPSIFWSPGGDPIGFTLERLTYRGYLGRDTTVVAVEKGYLFPLGIRASLIEVHEREDYPDYAGNPVSYLIRRTFIVTPRRPRSYPGPYQPFAGREFPPRRVQLKTLATPDLAPIVNVPLALPAGAVPEKSVFWPQAVEGTTASDILFEWSTEDAASVRSKFIFVRNDVVGRQDVMRALVDYYNNEGDDRRSAWPYSSRRKAGAAAPSRANWRNRHSDTRSIILGSSSKART